MDHGKALVALLIDLSKGSDCLPHFCLLQNLWFMVKNLKAHGFDNNSLKLVTYYLSHRFQRTKSGIEYSSSKEIISSVSQGSILGPLFFNIHLGDLFFIIEKFDIANFADGNTSYVTEDNISSVLKPLEEVACAIFQWFKNNG